MKRLLILIFLLFTSGSGFASQEIHFVDIFQQGYKKGYDEGYVAGYRQAVEDFKKMFQSKLDEYKAIEAGKFLLDNWYISYPRLFQVPTERGVEIRVEGCQVLRPFDDLVAQMRDKIPFIERKEDVSVRTKREEVKREDEIKKGYSAVIPKRLTQEVISSGFKYETVPEVDHIIVHFPDERAYRQFCLEYGC